MKYKLNPEFKEFKTHLGNIKKLFNSSSNSIHKARNELKIVEIDGVKYVIKSFKIPHLINKIAYTFFRDSKAKKSFDNAMKLKELDIKTPKPVAMVEFFRFGLLDESYFVSLYEPYDFTIREVFHHKVDDTKEILRQFASFTYHLHQKGVWHVDYSLGNILITKKQNHYEFSLVDINRMEFREILPFEGLKNFNKFWAKFDEDLPIIATEYAKEANIDTNKAIKIVLSEAKKLENRVRLKRKLKGKK